MAAIRKILVPTDFSECSKRALDYAVEFAQKVGATIDVLHVWDPPYYLVPDVMVTIPGSQPERLGKYARDQAAKELDGLLTDLRAKGLTIEGTVQSGEPAAEIADRAQRDRADLIIMGTHGRSGFKKLVLGSVAEKLLRHASCPILTVRGPE